MSYMIEDIYTREDICEQGNFVDIIASVRVLEYKNGKNILKEVVRSE